MKFRLKEAINPVYDGSVVSIVGELLAAEFKDDGIPKVSISNHVTGKTALVLDGDGESILALAMSPDQNLVAFVSRSRTMFIYSLKSGEKVHEISRTHDSAVQALVIDSTSSLAATGSTDTHVKIWDLNTGQITHVLKGHGGPISALSFYSRLGSRDWRLASGSLDSRVRVWNLMNSKCVAMLENHNNKINCLDWSTNGEVLLVGGNDRIVSVYREYNLMSTIPFVKEVIDVGFWSNLIYIVTHDLIKLIDLRGSDVAVFRTADFEDFDKCFRQKNTLIVKSYRDFLELKYEETLICTRFFTPGVAEVHDIVVTDDSLIAVTESHLIRVFSRSHPFNFKPLTIIPNGSNDANERHISESSSMITDHNHPMAISLSGLFLAAGFDHGLAYLWKLDTMNCISVFKGHAGPVGAIAVSTEISNVSRFIFTGSQDLTIKKWCLDGTALWTRKAHEKEINVVVVSPGGKRVLSGSVDRTAKIWDSHDGSEIGVLKGHRRAIIDAVFSENQELTAFTSSADKTIREWNLGDFTCLRIYEGHSASVLSVAVYGNRFVVSGSADCLAKIWDTKTGENIATLDNHHEWIWRVAAIENGIVSAGRDGVISMWEDCTIDEENVKAAELKQSIERQQLLDNAIRENNWNEAVKLALKLNHPSKLLDLFSTVAAIKSPGSITGLAEIDSILIDMSESQAITILERVRDWNSNSRTCNIAQRVLCALLKNEAIKRSNSAIVFKLISGILPYSRRHYDRFESLVEASYAIDYTTGQIGF